MLAPCCLRMVSRLFSESPEERASTASGRARVPQTLAPRTQPCPAPCSRASTTHLFLRPIAGGSPASPCTPPLMLCRHRLLILTASESHPWPLALISTACLRHLSRAVARTEPKRVRRRPAVMGTCRRASSGAGTLPWVATRRRPHTSQPPPRFPDPSIGSGEVLEEATHSYAQTPARSHTRTPRTPADHPSPLAAQKSLLRDLLPSLPASSPATPHA